MVQAPSPIARVKQTFAHAGIRSLLERSVDWVARRYLPFETYWTLASKYYSRRRAVRGATAPLDPVKVEWVDPRRIVRNSHRPYPAWRHRWDDVGTVHGGDWDRPDDTHPLEPRFADRIDYRALKSHFLDGTRWTETEYVSLLIHNATSGTVDTGHRLASRSDVLERCRFLDELYTTIRDQGFRSQYDLARRGLESRSFPGSLINEITVDIGRNGELLFVNGSHRLSIAKLLELRRVPVAFVVRHEQWVRYRDESYGSDDDFEHPDLRELATSY